MILLQCTSVVIKNTALERCLENGVEDFRAIAPNSKAYSDDFISQCSFMENFDAREFVKQLELRGIQVETEGVEIVVVHCSDPKIPANCDWLQLHQYKDHILGRHPSDDSQKLIAPHGFSLDGEADVQHYTREEIEEKLEFVRRDENIDVYRDKETGKELYVGRTTESLEDLYHQSAATIRENFRHPGEPPVAEEKHPEVRKAIDGLQRVVGQHPEFWQAHFFTGKGWQALGEHQKAYNNFFRAHNLEKENTAICKEIAGACLELGNAEEGVGYAEIAVTCDPEDAELICNLAICHLLAGNGEAAQKSIERAVKLDAEDDVSNNVARLIGDVISKKRPWPKSLADL